ncbi:MAG: isoleucine--tRNA ligase [Actinobacteria bacterium]|nr:isoleucine--tRNA ligase [Actinomycetota bacterium]
MADHKVFRPISPEVSFPALEAGILRLWDEIDAFGTSVEMRPPESEFTFYDGPPFPTGSPHYGTLLAGLLKDVVPRYWTMRGHRVVRRFGWDTHGLPIEMEVQQQLGLSGPADIEAFGVERFNEAARALVAANTGPWQAYTRRIGRWVDFEHDYKTLDLGFMESVWWVFRSLWDRGLIYRAFKVLPYSYGAATPLSNFEANMDYRDVEDPSLTVRLEVTAGRGPVQAGDHLLVWTTTPWTLPANLAVAVGADLDYVRIDAPLGGHEGRYWIAAGLAASYWPDHAVHPAAAGRGAEMVGAAYRPPFDHFVEEQERGAFVVIAADEVSTAEGTGLVHMAPAYGEADFLALQQAGITALVDPVDAEARFTAAVPEVQGMNVKDADPVLLRLLGERGALVQSGRIVHSYPYCWRTGTPLIYKAIPTWFVRVEALRDRMVELNREIHWVPAFVGERRFGNWLAQARDWAISRNRYWGSCLPVWECPSCRHQVCVGSIEDLFQLSGVRLTDLHKHVVDGVTFPCPECGATMARVPEVLDVWFESGAMPYAQHHYPFEDPDGFARRFPADYIAEGLDQTRGWFYTLLVLSTALFDRAPFRNCVVNGLILSEDGRKMSKSLKNYPDPFALMESMGADALRAYLINSPVVRAEPLRFSEEGVREVVRSVMLPLWNAFSFFTTYAAADGIDATDLAAAPPPADRPEIDRWVLSVLQSLVARVNGKMEGYFLYDVVPPMIDFVDDLTNWYIRRSRRRFWRQRHAGGASVAADTLAAFATLYEVLVAFAKVMAPVLPFVTEALYQELVVARAPADSPVPRSVHHCDYPEADPALIDPALEADMAVVREVVSLGRGLRRAQGLRVRQPLPSLTVVSHDAAVRAAVAAHTELIAEELNVKAVAGSDDERAHARLSAKPNYRRLGPRLGPRMKGVAAAIEALDEDALAGLLSGSRVRLAGEEIVLEDVVVGRAPLPGVVVAAAARLAVALDTTLTPALVREGLAREVVKAVQARRRAAGLHVSDRITLTWATDSAEVADALETHSTWVAGEVLALDLRRGEPGPGEPLEVDGHTVRIEVTRAAGPGGTSAEDLGHQVEHQDKDEGR